MSNPFASNNTSQAPAERIEQIAATQGTTEAYHALVNDYQNASSNLSPDEMSRYWESYTSDLQHRRILPALAVNWLNDNFDQVDGIHKNGTVDRSELRNVSDPFGRVFASEFLEVHKKHDFFRQVANLPGAEGGGINEIEREDLRQYMHKDDRRVRREARQAGRREDMAPLMEGDDPLINALNSGKNPDRITSREMKDFIRQCEAFDRQGVPEENRGPYTSENAQYVEDLRKGEYKDINAHGGIPLSKLARRGGFDYHQRDDGTTEDAAESFELADKHPNQENAPVEAYEERVDVDRQEPESGSESEPEGEDRRRMSFSPAEITRDATVKPGEGYSHVAARLLDIDVSGGWNSVAPQDRQKIWRLTEQLAEVHGGKGRLPSSVLNDRGKTRPLYAGDTLVNAEIFRYLMSNNPDLRARMLTEEAE
ncbi:MAG: hypothetical protein IPM23_05255 [Candidatus Melainabacteria bacterium]|nr:hypothetical protein [Candidatus Melainabacteria bacterium]